VGSGSGCGSELTQEGAGCVRGTLGQAQDGRRIWRGLKILMFIFTVCGNTGI
jgi:hypothetical protein